MIDKNLIIRSFHGLNLLELLSLVDNTARTRSLDRAMKTHSHSFKLLLKEIVSSCHVVVLVGGKTLSHLILFKLVLIFYDSEQFRAYGYLINPNNKSIISFSSIRYNIEPRMCSNLIDSVPLVWICA